MEDTPGDPLPSILGKEPAGSSGPDYSPGALTDTLDQLIASKTFSRSGQLKRLLVYLREGTASNDPHVWSEAAIGAVAFGRKDFNPKLDTIVRVEMRRLRQKLDEYYAGEGATMPSRLRFEKNAYRPFVEPYLPPVVEQPAVEQPVVPPPPARSAGRFWIGTVCGALSLALAMLAAGLIRNSLVASGERASSEIAANPIWSGFQSTNVVVAVGTPLFFRSEDGFERTFHLNLPDDLQKSDQHLMRRPAVPQWNMWAPFDDIGAAVDLDHFLRGLNSTITVMAARRLSVDGLAGRRTIVIGQPRGAPLLLDLLADQHFRPPAHITGETLNGFVDSQPKAGEPERYPVGQTNFLMETDESNPDYALLSSIRLGNGGEVLSLFGNRVQTGGYITRKLTDPIFLSELKARVFSGNKRVHQSLQIVFRVDYNRSTPTGLVYLKHHIEYAR